jgi:tRNA-intron endonuclease
MTFATLKSDFIIVANKSESNRLYNNGFIGTFTKNRLKLSLIEACYLLENKKIEIKGQNFISLFQYSALSNAKFGTNYYVYRDLKNKGYKVTVQETRFETLKDGKPKVVIAYDLGTFVKFDKILEQVKEHEEHIIAVIDEDLEITYFLVSRANLKGEFKIDIENCIIGTLLEKNVILEGAKEIGAFGKKSGSLITLSLLESEYLLEKGILKLRGYSADEFLLYAKERDVLFDLKYKVYKKMTDNGLFLKAGFKFGTDFRAYAKNLKDHAEYLVHIFFRDENMGDIARGVRLAHGVNKNLILTDGNEFIQIAWYHP